LRKFVGLSIDRGIETNGRDAQGCLEFEAKSEAKNVFKK